MRSPIGRLTPSQPACHSEPSGNPAGGFFVWGRGILTRQRHLPPMLKNYTPEERTLILAAIAGFIVAVLCMPALVWALQFVE